MTVYAIDEHEREDLPWPVPADYWFWQTPDRWVAVYAEFHPDWWEGADSTDVAARPEPWQLPIDQRPKGGVLVYRDATGNEHEELTLAEPDRRISVTAQELLDLIIEADEALEGDSNDAEHDALYSLRESLSNLIEGRPAS